MAVDQEKSIGKMAGDYAPGQFVAGPNVCVRDVRGRGGHATVYEVEAAIDYDGRIERLGKRYALKVLHPHHATNSEMSKRLVTEAITLGKLNHPNVVQIFNAGFTIDRRAFILMELLEGINGRQLLRNKKRLPIENALEITRGLAGGLAAAHAVGAVHQDIKPDNIFVSLDGRDGSAICKLYDFGIQRRVEESKTAGSATQEMVYEGTPVYSAPEQLQGGTIGPRADIYAFGVVLFEFLTGKRPFHVAEELDERQARQRGRDLASDTSYPNTATCVIDAKLTQEAPKLSAFLPVPPELENLVASCLSREPTARPESASVVEKELGLILESLDPFFKTAVDTTQDLLLAAVRSVKPSVVETMGIAARGGDTVSLKEQPRGADAAKTWKPNRSDRAPEASEGIPSGTEAERVATARLPPGEREDKSSAGSEVVRDVPRTLEGVLRHKPSSLAPREKSNRLLVVGSASVILLGVGASLFVWTRTHSRPTAVSAAVTSPPTIVQTPPVPSPAVEPIASVAVPSGTASALEPPAPPASIPPARATPPAASSTTAPATSARAATPSTSASPARPHVSPSAPRPAPTGSATTKPKLSNWLEH